MKFSAPRARFWAALVVSLLFHLVLGGGLVLSPSQSFKKQRTESSVELVSPEEFAALADRAKVEARAATRNNQIVETDKQRINDEKDPNAKFLSQFDQKVQRETKAARHGRFQNESGQGPKAKALDPQPQADRKDLAEKQDQKTPEAKEKQTGNESDIATHEHGDFAVGRKKGLQAFNPTFRKMPVVPDPTIETAAGDGRDASATDDHLKDVKTGMQTMLSTREFVYYSYYNRIKDKLRQHWEPKIKEKFERIVRQGRTIASEGDRITKVVIILDERGTLIRVQVVSRSGVTDLDEAAVEAFRAAAPFPNPPKGIVEEDGTIKIRWDFVLEA